MRAHCPAAESRRIARKYGEADAKAARTEASMAPAAT